MFPQTRGLILTYSKSNYSETMRCTNLGGQLLCARPVQYDPLMIVATQSPGNRRAKKGVSSSADDDEAGNTTDTNQQQIYMGDGVCVCNTTHVHTRAHTHKQHTETNTHKHTHTDPEIIQDGGRAVLLRCPLGACGENNTCEANRVGPLCGYCAPGAVMTSTGCGGMAGGKPCPPPVLSSSPPSLFHFLSHSHPLSASLPCSPIVNSQIVKPGGAAEAQDSCRSGCGHRDFAALVYAGDAPGGSGGRLALGTHASVVLDRHT